MISKRFEYKVSGVFKKDYGDHAKDASGFIFITLAAALPDDSAEREIQMNALCGDFMKNISAEFVGEID